MSRYIAADLAALGDVPAVESLDFEAIKEARDAYLIAALSARGIDYNVNNLETDPLVIAFSEAGGYEELRFRQRINDAVRAVMSATAVGGDLDHIAATFTGIARLVYDNEENDQPVNSQWDAALGKWVELDDIFRARIILAFEAFSTAGPQGAYQFYTLQLDGVRDIADAAVYSEEDGASYTVSEEVLYADAYTAGQRAASFEREDEDDVLAPEVLIVILPAVAYGDADQDLIDRAYAAVTGAEVRPIGDNVRVEQAQIDEYTIDVTLTYAPGADPSVLAAEAETRLAAYAADRRRIGAVVQREIIGGRAAVDNTVEVTITSPATNVDPGPKGAAHCTGITVTTVQSVGGWQ